MRLAIFILTVTLSAPAFAQDLTGEIEGQITDRQRSGPGAALPGVRITVVSRDQRFEAIGDADGRFRVQPLLLGTYTVTAELAGFVSVTHSITLSPEARRAHLEWSLERGCIHEDVRIVMDIRQAVAVVDAVIAFEVEDDSEPMIWPAQPSCGSGVVAREYTVRPMHAFWREQEHYAQSKPLAVLRRSSEPRLIPGQTYLAYLVWQPWSNRLWLLDERLIFPVRRGRIDSPRAGELNTLLVTDAVAKVRQWSERRR